MGEAARAHQQLELDVVVQGSSVTVEAHKTRSQIRRWIRVAVYSFFVVAGQAIATLLGRVYYAKGGNSVWVETVVQIIGFPVLLPLYLMAPPSSASSVGHKTEPGPSRTRLALVYASLGLLIAGDTILYSLGLNYLPVSTFSLISSSQLAFNALFSSFLNGQKFTPYIINSVFVLTMSSVILVFHNQDSSSIHESKAKYALGFVLTVAASAGFGLYLSLSQLIFRKVLRGNGLKVVLDLIVCPFFIASVVTCAGLLASGQGSEMTKQMEEYELGRAMYVMNLIGTAVLWQVFQLGCIGLVFEVSSLFSNVVGTLGLPVTPVLAVIFLHDKLTGLKMVSMIMAIWGFISYAYQQYVDDFTVTDQKDPGEES